MWLEPHIIFLQKEREKESEGERERERKESVTFTVKKICNTRSASPWRVSLFGATLLCSPSSPVVLPAVPCSAVWVDGRQAEHAKGFYSKNAAILLLPVKTEHSDELTVPDLLESWTSTCLQSRQRNAQEK